MYAASSKATAESTASQSSSNREETTSSSSDKRTLASVSDSCAEAQQGAKKRKAPIPTRSEFAKEWEAQVQWNKQQQHQTQDPTHMATLNETPVKPAGAYSAHPFNMSVPQQGFAGFMHQLNLYGQQRQQYLGPNYQVQHSMPPAMPNGPQPNGLPPVPSGLQENPAAKMQQHQQVSVSSLPLLYKQEIEAYRALVVSTREREQHIQWLETRLKEHGLVDANQPSALSTPIPMLPSQTSPAGHHVMMQPHNFATTSGTYSSTSAVKVAVNDVTARLANDASKPQELQRSLSAPLAGTRGTSPSFSTRDYLRGDDTPDLIHDKKVGRVSFVQPGSVPTFIQEELKNAPGNGQFTICELMITLCFAHQLLFHRNTYSTIKKRMLNKRSRASIRRKIEKIVFKETGIDGGLLLAPEEKRIQILSCLWSRFAKLIDEAIVYGSPALEAFSKKLRNYANVANATEENVKSGTAWVIKEPKPK